jgi:hypothetical protein
MTLKDRAQLFHHAIRQVLLEWDPIGVSKLPEAQDEYDPYVPTIYRMLVQQKPQHEVFDYLWWLETQHMGLTGDRQATESYAARLMSIVDELDKTKRRPVKQN